MKKIVIIASLVIVILSIIKEEKIIIPKEVIRFRVIANSNEEIDQQVKKEVVKNVTPLIKKMNQLTTLEESRNYIQENLPQFTEIVDKTLENNNYEKKFTINYGKNFFPKKNYQDIIFEEGEYESLVITLGDGLGDNFWCLLFPPVCLSDQENDKVEYKSFLKEILEKYF